MVAQVSRLPVQCSLPTMACSSIFCRLLPSIRPPSTALPLCRSEDAYSIFFDEKFSIPLDPAALEEKSLRFSVFGIDEDERNNDAHRGGGAEALSLTSPLQPFSGWLYLQDQNKVSLPICTCQDGITGVYFR